MAAVDSFAGVNALIETPCDQCDRLHAIVRDAFVTIAHIGCTASSRLVVKPIIDITAAVDSLAAVSALFEPPCDRRARLLAIVPVRS